MKKPNDLLGFLKKIDFKKLRQQKRYLNEHCDSLGGNTHEYEAVEGVIALLDDLQDKADKLGIEGAFAPPSKNENCLEGIRCPDCGNEDYFHIAVLSFMDVTDHGTGSNMCDTEWDGNSAIECGECHLLGKVWMFQS